MTTILVVGDSWITKYWIAECLYADSNNEYMIDVITDGNIDDFFSDSIPTLKEFVGDERLNLINDVTKLDISNYESVLFSWIFEPKSIVEKLERFDGNVVLLSSREVYGWKSMHDIPIKETAWMDPESVYGKSCLAYENMLTNVKNLSILRLCDIFGPYNPASDNEIHTIIKQALLNEPIYISQPASRNLDITYITNVLKPINAALDGDHYGIFNVGSGDEKKITNIARAIKHELKSDSVIEISDNITTDNRGYHSQMSIERAQKELGYYPLTELLRGFLQTARWIESTLDTKLDPLMQTYPTLDPRVKKVVDHEGQLHDLGGD